MRQRRCWGSLLLATLLLFSLVPGCADPPKRLRAAARYRRGLVLVLPGIEGRSVLNRNLAVGLDQGGVTSAIEIADWTVGVPGVYLPNLLDLERNRRAAARLAARIEAYRREYPGRPVHLVGHSGGGGIAVLTLEALPEDGSIEMALLLAPAVSPDYDLSAALRRTRRGLCNFYSARDVTLLKVGTTIFGSIDRVHGTAAGAAGFKPPPGLTDAGRELYAARLRQVEWTPRLRRYGADGTHVGWVTRRFARTFLAPLIQRNEARRGVGGRAELGDGAAAGRRP